MRNLYYSCFLLILLSCASNQNKELENILRFAGENRFELEKVLTHYQNDSLKLEAARFLILNMPGHGTYSNEKTDTFYTALDTLLPYDRNIEQSLEKINLLIDKTSANIGLKLKEDIHFIKADFLINNIDLAFEAWQKDPFARQLDFDDFCEYILPYRIGEEPLEYWRDSITPRYNKIKELGYMEGSEYSTYWACCAVNDSLKNEYRPQLNHDNWTVTRKYSILRRIPYGTCQSYAELATYVMRAKGIPVMIDYTPQWPFRSMGHSWNVVKANNGVNIPFGGVDTNPGDRHKPDAKMAKVYRKTYGINWESLACKKPQEPIPGEFRSPFIKDVSNEYFKGADVEIPLEFEPSKPREFVYLYVFDNKEWIPVSFAEKKGKKARFTQMGRDILYLPAYHNQNKPIPASYPFLLDLRGNVHFCKPDTTHLQKRILNRKYTINQSMYDPSERMVKGEIQGSNLPNFRQAETFYTIKENPKGKRERVEINPEGKKYRYWRYLAPEYAFGNICELEFYQQDSLYNVNGTIIGIDGSYRDQEGYTKEKAFDGDPLTFFDAPSEHMNDGWVGLDFKHPVSFSSVAYTGRNDGNYVFPGDEYELFYFGEKGWVSLGKQIATGYDLTYDSVPDNALLWLRDLTKGSEERIFTINNDKVYWW